MSNMEPIVDPVGYKKKNANMPLRPYGKSRVLAANSFARLPVRGGQFSVGVAQQIGYRKPRLTGLGAAMNPGLWIAAVDRESLATARGALATDEMARSRKGRV